MSLLCRACLSHIFSEPTSASVGHGSCISVSASSCLGSRPLHSACISLVRALTSAHLALVSLRCTLHATLWDYGGRSWTDL